MSKKMYDILPPKMAHKVEDAVRAMGGDHKKKKPHAGKSRSHKKENRFPLKELIVGGVIILALLSVYLYNKLPKADIGLWPQVQVLDLEEKITAEKSATQVSVAKNIIPAAYFEESKEATQEFEATGSASNEGRASGTIKIYNKITPSSPLTLKAGTHFLSDSGK